MHSRCLLPLSVVDLVNFRAKADDLEMMYNQTNNSFYLNSMSVTETHKCHTGNILQFCSQTIWGYYGRGA